MFISAQPLTARPPSYGSVAWHVSQRNRVKNGEQHAHNDHQPAEAIVPIVHSSFARFQEARVFRLRLFRRSKPIRFAQELTLVSIILSVCTRMDGVSGSGAESGRGDVAL